MPVLLLERKEHTKQTKVEKGSRKTKAFDKNLGKNGGKPSLPSPSVTQTVTSQQVNRHAVTSKGDGLTVFFREKH